MTVRDAQHTVKGATGARVASRIQSVERAAALLRAVAVATGPAASATALAEAVGLNRTTTWRLLSTLEDQRLVWLDRETGWYSLGFGLVDLAGQAGAVALGQPARAVLQRVAAETGESAGLAVLRDSGLTYVAEASARPDVPAWQGRQVPAHATSTGKVLLAFSEGADVPLLLGLGPGRRLPRHTSTTITSLSRLERELTRTRERGYAVCRGEFETTAWGVSAPVLDATARPVAVVTIWGPSTRLTEDRFEELGAVARAAAAEIAGRPVTREADAPRTTPGGRPGRRPSPAR